MFSIEHRKKSRSKMKSRERFQSLRTSEYPDGHRYIVVLSSYIMHMRLSPVSSACNADVIAASALTRHQMRRIVLYANCSRPDLSPTVYSSLSGTTVKSQTRQVTLLDSF